MKTKYNYTPGEIIHTRDGRKTLLTYLSESDTRTGKRRMVNVSCSCGKEWSVQLSNILNGTTFCCGKYPCRTYKYLYEGRRDPEVGYRALLYVYKKHADRRGLTFELSYERFKELLAQNCHYCNTPPSQVYKLLDKKTGEIRSGVPIIYNGIDRVDPCKNYTEDNVVACCGDCNIAKLKQTYDGFLQQVIRIYNNLNLKDYVPPAASCHFQSEEMGRKVH